MRLRATDRKGTSIPRSSEFCKTRVAHVRRLCRSGYRVPHDRTPPGGRQTVSGLQSSPRSRRHISIQRRYGTDDSPFRGGPRNCILSHPGQSAVFGSFRLAELFSGESRFGDAHAHAKLHAVNDAYSFGCTMELQARVWYDQRMFERVRSEVSHAINVYGMLRAAEDLGDCRELLQLPLMNRTSMVSA
jgi:hypothetical protein